MGWFITGLILIAVAIVGGIIALRAIKKEFEDEPATGPKILVAAVAALLIIIGGWLLTISLTYTQDPGEANVLKDITGNVIGQNNDTGLQFKAPWVDVITYNIRNQQIVFAGADGDQSDNSGGEAAGPQITVQDQDGVSSNVDIAVRYSIKPDSVTDIFNRFKTEDNFKASFIEQDIRSAVRLVPNKFSTLDLITNRADVETGVITELKKRWDKFGVTVDSVSLQEIRVPESVRTAYSLAQEAQVNVSTEQAKLEAAKVSSQTVTVTAEAQANADIAAAKGTAEANRLLTQSLTPEVLQNKYLEAIKNGTTFVVPAGTTPLITTGK